MFIFFPSVIFQFTTFVFRYVQMVDNSDLRTTQSETVYMATCSLEQQEVTFITKSVTDKPLSKIQTCTGMQNNFIPQLENLMWTQRALVLNSYLLTHFNTC